MAASSFFNITSLPKPCSKSHLPLSNLSVRLNLKYSIPGGELKTRPKTTSFARINNEQDAHLAKEEKEDQKPTAMMTSKLEEIVEFIKFLVVLPVEFVVSLVSKPRDVFSSSKASILLFLAAVAIIVVLPGGSSEWWLAKSAIGAGLLVTAASLWLLGCFGL